MTHNLVGHEWSSERTKYIYIFAFNMQFAFTIKYHE